MSEMNKSACRVIEAWSPLPAAAGQVDKTAERVVAELAELDYPTDLAKAIQSIYWATYDQWIPFEQCVAISYKLLAVKYEAKCII